MTTTTLSPDKQTLCTAIKEDFTVNDKGNVERPDDLYERHLPEGITMETLKRIKEHDRVFFPAAFEAFAEVSEAALNENREIDRTSLKFNTIEDDQFSAQYQRSVKRAAKGENGKVGSETGYGAASCKYSVQVMNADEHRSIQERFASRAKKLFAE